MKAEKGMEEGGYANVKLKSQWRPSQSRKESILNILLEGSGGFIYKSKGGIGSALLDQEITDLLEEAGNNCSGSENSGSLFRWTYNYLEEKLNNGSLFETTLSL